MRDTKIRFLRNSEGTRDAYRLRRLACRDCGKLHTELPACMQPKKHYATNVIEAVLDGMSGDCPADNSTISRWKAAFREAWSQLEGMLISLWSRYHKIPFPLTKEHSLLRTLQSNGPGWLAVVTGTLVNSGLKPHTRFAFCPSFFNGRLPLP